MANAFRGEVAAKYEGEDYTIVLDFNALCDFEGETGKNALTALDGMEKGEVNASDMRALMWAALRQNHPEMTLQLAGKILSENVGAIAEASAVMVPDADRLGNASSPQKKRAKRA